MLGVEKMGGSNGPIWSVRDRVVVTGRFRSCEPINDTEGGGILRAPNILTEKTINTWSQLKVARMCSLGCGIQSCRRVKSHKAEMFTSRDCAL